MHQTCWNCKWPAPTQDIATIGGPDCVCHPGGRHLKDRKRATLIAELENRQQQEGVIVNRDPGDENDYIEPGST